VTVSAFGTRRVLALAGAAVVSLGAAAYLGIWGGELSEPTSVGTDAFSGSAIGHAAFVALLRELGFQVLLSRSRTAERAEGAVLIMAEPALRQGDDGAAARARALYEASSRMLLVLPKRWGTPSPTRPHWLGTVRMSEETAAKRALDALKLEAEVVRPARDVGATEWKGELPAPTLTAPQLVRSSHLTPLVACDEGILVGELLDEDAGVRLLVLSDPDIIANHGLGKGEISPLAVRLIERLGGAERPVLVDETLHGHELTPSLARELFRFPLVLATLQALITGALLAWAALVRFGRPRRSPAALPPGKAFLVANTADLLRHGGHLGAVLEMYLRAARDEIIARLRLGTRTGEGPDRSLARVAAARGLAERLDALKAQVSHQPDEGRTAAEAAVQTARAIYAFREEMTDGARSNRGSTR
jgi:hypothetical protein